MSNGKANAFGVRFTDVYANKGGQWQMVTWQAGIEGKVAQRPPIQFAVMPPSMTSSLPVTHEASSEAR